MTATTEKIREKVRHLPFVARVQLVKALEDDLDRDEKTAGPEIEAAWDAEIQSRVDEVKSGKVKLLSQKEFDSAFSEARRRVAARRKRA